MKQQLQSDNCLLWQLFLLEMWSLSKVNSEGSFWKVKAPLLTHIFTFYFQLLTELIKVCVYSVRSRDRTHKSGFKKGGPFIGQTPQPTYIILKHNHIHCDKTIVSIVQLSSMVKKPHQNK